LFPDNIDTFIDLFCGGCNVAVNVKADKIICNDTIKEISELYHYFRYIDTNKIIKQIESVVKKFKLTKNNQDNYLKLRQYYNQGNKEWYYFYTLICHSFSNQIRFNSKGEFNLPFGKRTFNPTMKDNLIKFVNYLQDTDMEFTNLDFREVDISYLTDSDFC